ncbi:MAG TPA: cytochrome c biogenesis protein ResB [Candidatus Limnocylindrales bacterium]|nr:cytochrome c biogenesis protein ResB [Candidatus Limnocylindrales bacterium]
MPRATRSPPTGSSRQASSRPPPPSGAPRRRVIATIAAGRPATQAARPDPFTRLGAGIWSLFTSVNFAVLQIILLALGATIGMTIRQLPDFAFRSLTAYRAEMAEIHARYDPVFGAGLVDLLERLQVFQVFKSTWFSAGLLVLIFSIVICTLDRTPRLWRQSKDVRVVQPDPFFDPRLPDRARMSGPDAGRIGDVLRRNRFSVREAEVDGIRYLYGDRNRWTKLATLFTHTGLILFLVAAGVTWKLGDEQPLVIAEGDALTVQPIGTPGLLLVRNLGFEAPGIENGEATDFTSDLVVYRDGQEIARKTIRVNDPLSVAGYTLHQNGFGPAPDLVLRDRDGAVLWAGPVPLTDSANGFPYGTMPVPGRDLGLEMLLLRDADGIGTLIVIPYRIRPGSPTDDPIIDRAGDMAIQAGERHTLANIDFSVELRRFSDFTLLIAKHDPGQGIVWLAFGSLITGLAITFYLPRRRVWTRLTPAGELSIVGRSDRYVDFDREFGRLLDDLVAARRAG